MFSCWIVQFKMKYVEFIRNMFIHSCHFDSDKWWNLGTLHRPSRLDARPREGGHAKVSKTDEKRTTNEWRRNTEWMNGALIDWVLDWINGTDCLFPFRCWLRGDDSPHYSVLWRVWWALARPAGSPPHHLGGWRFHEFHEPKLEFHRHYLNWAMIKQCNLKSLFNFAEISLKFRWNFAEISLKFR